MRKKEVERKGVRKGGGSKRVKMGKERERDKGWGSGGKKED